MTADGYFPILAVGTFVFNTPNPRLARFVGPAYAPSRVCVMFRRPSL